MTQQNELFNRHWAIYQAVVKSNVMFHRQFADMARGVFEAQSKAGALDILDLGCGDGAHIQGVLETVPVHSYTGYDLSGSALGIAHASLEPVIPVLHLLEGPMEKLIEQEHAGFDVVYSGYAVHHLSDDGKAELLKRVHDRLRPGGVFVLVDVYREEGQTREAYLDAMSAWIQHTWDCLDQEQKGMIFEHLRGFDFPAMRSMVTGWGREAGFDVNWNPAFDKWHHGVVMRKAVA